jgi:hypothetical protein
MDYMATDPESLLIPKYRLSDDDMHKAWAVGFIERMQGGDGYDVMSKVEHASAEQRWVSIGGWGADGWNLGDWPYVVIYCRNDPVSGMYQVAYYVEGDVTIYRYATARERNRAIDGLAFFHWRALSESWVEGIESAKDMPMKLCGPYSSKRSGLGRVLS